MTQVGNMLLRFTCVLLSIWTVSCKLGPFGPTFQPIAVKVKENYVLPMLHYDYDELEPYIDQKTVVAHHLGHHENYKNKMNAVLKEWRTEEPDNELAFAPIMDIIQKLNHVPEKYQTPLRHNGGGYVNHAFYWAGMSPNNQSEERLPTGKLLEDIEKSFGTYDQFKEIFTKEAMGVFGSGYVWLTRIPGKSTVHVSSSSDQDSPLMAGFHPILVIDVWEHAYYLKHHFKRADYIKDWWMLVDWQNVVDNDEWWNKIMSKSQKDEL